MSKSRGRAPSVRPGRRESAGLGRLAAALDEAGIDEAVYEDAALGVISKLRLLRVEEPSLQFTGDEVAALRAGGMDLSPRQATDPDPVTETAAQFAALLADSADVREVAHELQVTPARIRQRAIERTLFSIREDDEWRFPKFQFDDWKPIRGLSAVVSALAPDLHPVGAWRFLSEPNADLELADQLVSPISWLRSGGSPEPVVAIAREL